MRDKDTIMLEKAYHDILPEQYKQPTIVIDGKKVDLESLVIAGIIAEEYPNYEDAYATYAEFTDSKPLTECELKELTQTDAFREHVLANAWEILDGQE